MKLWLLEPIRDPDRPSDPWTPRYDKAQCFVVRATNEAAARRLAGEDAGDETSDAWTDPVFSTCVPLMNRGPAGVIIRDFYGV